MGAQYVDRCSAESSEAMTADPILCHPIAGRSAAASFAWLARASLQAWLCYGELALLGTPCYGKYDKVPAIGGPATR